MSARLLWRRDGVLAGSPYLPALVDAEAGDHARRGLVEEELEVLWRIGYVDGSDPYGLVTAGTLRPHRVGESIFGVPFRSTRRSRRA